MNVLSPPLADDPSWTGTQDMILQNDGKIVVLARAYVTETSTRNVLIRYTPDGQLDASFASGGFLYLPTSGSKGSYVRRIIKQTISGQERFILAGGGPCDSVSCLTVERYTTDGTLDPSFGSGGVSVLPNNCFLVTAAAAQNDQKIVLGCPQYPLVRLNANGSPDTSFGRNGIATFNDIRMLVSSIIVLPDGKILTAGSYLNTASSDMYVARFTSTGKADASFGSQGKSVIDFAGMRDGAQALAVDAAGNILAAGYATINGELPDSNGLDAVVVRLTSKGALDKRFGTNGRTAFLNIEGGEDQYRSIAVEPGGKIVVIGRGTLAGNPSDILVARYTANGSMDTTFHTDGWNLTDVYGGYDGASTGLIQFDPGCSCSKLVVTGTGTTESASSSQSIFLARYGM